MCHDCPWFERRESVAGSVTRLTTVASPLFSTSSYRPFLLQTAANQPVPVQHTPTPVRRRTAPKEPRLAVVARLLAELHVRLVYLPCRRLYWASFFRLSPTCCISPPLPPFLFSYCDGLVCREWTDGWLLFFFFFFWIRFRPSDEIERIASNIERLLGSLENIGSFDHFLTGIAIEVDL